MKGIFNKLPRTLLFSLLLTIMSAAAQTPREQTVLNVFGRLNLTEENQYEYLNVWTDGSAFYRPFFYDTRNFDAPYRSDGNTIYFVGGNLHEGGIGHEVVFAADGTMTMAGDYRYNKGDRMEYRTIGGKPMLIISDVRTKTVKEAWRKMEEGLRDLSVNNLLRYGLAGIYRIADGKTVTFPSNRFCVTGLWDGNGCTTYLFGEENEYPVLTLVHPDKDKAFVVRKTLTGLELFPAKFSQEDVWWEKDEAKPRIVLDKTAEAWSTMPLEGRQGIRGRFTLASDHVMTLEELRLYAGYPALENLKIMRNEIFARHGYKFKTTDMASYFDAKDWYVPQYDDVTSRLTEIERINIALIQELENM